MKTNLHEVTNCSRGQNCTEGQFCESDIFARRVIFAREQKISYKKYTKQKIKDKFIKNSRRKKVIDREQGLGVTDHSDSKNKTYIFYSKKVHI